VSGSITGGETSRREKQTKVNQAGSDVLSQIRTGRESVSSQKRSTKQAVYRDRVEQDRRRAEGDRDKEEKKNPRSNATTLNRQGKERRPTGKQREKKRAYIRL